MKDKPPVDETDLAPIEIELEDINIESDGSDKDALEDYRVIRDKILRAIIRSSDIMDEATKLIKADPSGKAIEASSKVLQSIADSSQKLLDIHEKIRQLEGGQVDENKKESNKTNVTDIIERFRVVNGGKEKG